MKSPCFPDTGDLTDAMMMEFEVKSVTTCEIGGESYVTQELECVSMPAYKPYTVVEGAGSVDGLLPFPQHANYTSGLYHTYYKLYKVADEDGTVIYVDPDGPPAGISTTPDTNEKDTVMLFDLNGMPVKEAKPGEVYIRQGKKVMVK